MLAENSVKVNANVTVASRAGTLYPVERSIS